MIDVADDLSRHYGGTDGDWLAIAKRIVKRAHEIEAQADR